MLQFQLRFPRKLFPQNTLWRNQQFEPSERVENCETGRRCEQ